MLTKEILDDLVYYNPNTGEFTFLYRDRSFFKSDGRHLHWNERFAGKSAGYIRNGYLMVCLFNKKYRAHRLAWLHMTGDFPSDQIDHINGNRSDNRWENLRAVCNSENGKNQKLRNTNKSGCCGVWWSKQRSKWIAEIMVNYKKIHIGVFEDFEDAVKARKEAEKEYDFHPNHGRIT